jgi:hypothetical protein
MDLGWVMGGAWRLVRRRRVWLLGMAIALLGLVYVAIDTWARLNDKAYLDELLGSLGATRPPNLGLYLAVGLLIAGLGGLISEGALIATAGRRLAQALPPPTEGRPVPVERPLGRTLRLLAVAGWVWWPLLLIGAIFLLPLLLWLLNPQGSEGWALLVLGSILCTSIVFLVGWWILWPINRLANCAALLDHLPARQAARLGATLWRRHLGTLLGLWTSVSLLNLLLVAVSVLLAGLGAVVVWGVLQVVSGPVPDAALPVALVVAAAVGALLLAWDGAITAFNLNAWVLAYCGLRSRSATVVLLPGADQPGGQALGRQRLPPVTG